MVWRWVGGCGRAFLFLRFGFGCLDGELFGVECDLVVGWLGGEGEGGVLLFGNGDLWFVRDSES